MSRLSGSVALLSLALGLSVIAPLTVETAAADPVVAPVPVLAWDQCSEDEGPTEGDVECTTAAVPLDYDDPTGPTVDLDLLRVPATGDPADRIGTLFVNPGGPGGSSRYFAWFFGELVPNEVSAKFDIVGIDPRGVGPSAPMICRTDKKRPGYPMAFFPTTNAEVKRQLAYNKWQRLACRDGGNRIVDHMSTADTARDMDLIRQAVGDTQLTYYGISYGTQLGATYAAMFPEQVRAIIIDGVLDPVAWSTGGAGDADRPFSERIGSGYGAWQSLTAALAECDRVGKKRCPIAGHAPEIWHEVVHKLRNRKGDQYPTYQDVVGTALGSLYDARSIGYLMRNLGALHKQLFDKKKNLLRSDAFDPRAARERADGVIPGPVRRVPGHQHLLLRSRLGPVPRGGLRRLGQPRQPAGLGGCGQARRPSLAVVRGGLDLGVQRLRRLAGQHQGRPVHRPLRRDHRLAGARRRQQLRPGDPAARRPRRQPAARRITAAGDGRLGTRRDRHRPVHRQRLPRLPRRRHPARGRHRLRAEAGAVPQAPLTVGHSANGSGSPPGSCASSSRAWAATLCSTSTS